MSNGDIDVARVYHEVTKHSYTSVRSVPHVLDWDNRPLPFKIYPTAAEITLPRDLILSAVPTLAALSGTAAALEDTALDLPMITRLLFCAGGITRRRRIGAENYHFRAAASAGALYPIELYLAAAEIDGLAPGLYHFSPADLKLRELRGGDWREFIALAAAVRPAILEARAVLMLSAIFWRSVWKYRARAYRYCFWDAGTILANLLAAANAEGLASEIISAFEDAPLEMLIGADSEREGMVSLVTLGRTVPTSVGSPDPTPLALETVALSMREVKEEDLTKIHRASRILSQAEVRAIAGARSPLPDARRANGVIPASVLESRGGLGLGETIVRRGSTRVFAREPIGADELATIITASTMPLRADFPRHVDIYLIVNLVEGLAPGAYYFQRESGTFDLLKSGDFRGEAGYLCLEQPLGADASALICYMADLERVLAALGNRGYRDVHLEAGLLGGRTYLAACALGRGATGLTFYDDDTTKFFSPHAAGKSPILMVALGVPRSPIRDVDVKRA
jgi:SagB-type dehydrogenase family enzyme